MSNNVFYQRPNSTVKVNKNETFQEQPIRDEEFETIYENDYNSEPVNEQEEKLQERKSKVKNFVLNIVLGILAFVFVILLIVFMNEMLHIGYRYVHDSNDLWYRIERGDYENLIDSVESNRGYLEKVTPKMQECYDVADYFKAASLYKVKEGIGDLDATMEYKAVMDEIRVKYESIDFIFEDMDSKLKLSQSQ